LKKLEATKSEVETAQKNFKENQAWIKRIQAQFGRPGEMPAQAKSEETKLEKTKEEIEAEREKIARDLASAQTRLRLARGAYNAAAQRRGGKKKRKQTRKNRQ
jgi:FtsZ-binding cell division protein ZapB